MNEVVNNKAQYCSVVRTGFGKVKLVIGGEVDASEYPIFFSMLYSVDTLVDDSLG